jgi:predicted dehydrogenase
MTSFTRRTFVSSMALQAVRLPRKVRVCLIGLQGHPSEITDPLPSLPDVELAGIADAAAKPRAGARLYTDWRRMLDQEKPDLVAVCNAGGPPRVEAILEVTQRGLPWIAEKPLANTMGDLNRIRQALRKKPVRYSMLLPMRFDPSYLALRKLVGDGAVGEVAQISAQKSYKWGNQSQWKRDPVTYGGTLPWIGSHMVDLMRWTSAREFTEVFTFQAQVGKFPEIGAMENTTGSVFQLDNRGVGTLHMDYYRPESAPTHGDDRLRLAGTKGVAEYMAATGVTLLTEGKKPEVIRDLPEKQSVFVDFLESVYGGKTQSLSEADIFRVCEIVLKARESGETGRPVKL